MLDKGGFAKLCVPAKIYFAIAVISSVVMLFKGFGMMMVFWKLLFAFVWTYVLGWLCKKGFSAISWFLVLLPYIIMLLAMNRIYHLSDAEKAALKSSQLQGAYGAEGFQGKTHYVLYLIVALILAAFLTIGSYM